MVDVAFIGLGIMGRGGAPGGPARGAARRGIVGRRGGPRGGFAPKHLIQWVGGPKLNVKRAHSSGVRNNG